MSLNLDKSTWRRVSFGDVVRNANETVRDPAAAGIDRIIAMEHLDPGELRIQRWGSIGDGTTFTRRVMRGQTLFGKRRAYQRKVAYADFEAVCSGDIYTFEADETRLLGGFLPFLVQSDRFFDHALSTSAGSLSPRTSWRDLANFEFDLPPIDEQKRLADLFWSIERHQISLERLARQAATLQAQWRVVLFEGSDSMARLDQRATVSLGRQRAPQHAIGSHLRPYVRSANIANDKVSTDDIKWMNFTPVEQLKFRLRPGDVLVSEGTASPRELGSSAMWDPADPQLEMYFQKTLLRLRPIKDRSTSPLLREWAKWARESGAFLKVATGTGILHITGVRCAAMPFPVLPPARQAALSQRADHLADMARAIQRELESATILRRALARDVFGGH